MNVSYYIAKRYLRSKSTNNAINFITIIAIVGIILGSGALFIVLSGFAGLRDFTLEFTSIVDPDLKVETTVGKSFTLTSKNEKQLTEINGIANYSKIIEERIFVSFDGANHPAYIKGVDQNYALVNPIEPTVQYGSWLVQNTSQIVVGWDIARSLSFGVLDYGKRVTLYVPKPGKGQITAVKQAFNKVDAVNVGIFDINPELNNKYVYASLDVARQLLNYQPNQLTNIEFKLTHNANETEVTQQIQSVLGNNITVKNRAQLNDALYKMLNTENLAVYLIFTLILIIAFFNVVGSLIMMMLDKKKSLSTLFNVGATVKDIRKIFFLQGTLMSVIGGIIGIIVSAIIVVLQKQFSLVMITASLPYPVSFRIENIIVVFLTITILGVIASKIASVRISKDLIKTS